MLRIATSGALMLWVRLLLGRLADWRLSFTRQTVSGNRKPTERMGPVPLIRSLRGTAANRWRMVEDIAIRGLPPCASICWGG